MALIDDRRGSSPLGRVAERVSEAVAGRTGGSFGSVLRRRGPLSSVYLAELVPVLLLVAYGLVVVWSASLSLPNASLPRQLLGVAIGGVAAVVIWRYDVRSLANMTHLLFALDIALMLLPHVPGLSYDANGMVGWIRVPFVGLTLQTSEIAKPVTILLMASVTAEHNGRIETLRDYVRLCAILLVPFVLILSQPDLGTGLVILVLGAAIIICGGARRSWVLVTLALLIAGVALIILTSSIEEFPFHILKPYQLNRLVVFIDPSADPTGSGYNLQQAKIAVGSGGLLGKGVGHATQAGQGFLPEAHTDFVFALLCEEFGFLGAIVLLGLFAWMVLATLALALRVESPFDKLVLVGMVAMVTFQVLENVGMCLGIMPITGIPLPFISQGSSSMLTQLMCVGIVQSLWRHRQRSA